MSSVGQGEERICRVNGKGNIIWLNHVIKKRKFIGKRMKKTGKRLSLQFVFHSIKVALTVIVKPCSDNWFIVGLNLDWFSSSKLLCFCISSYNSSYAKLETFIANIYHYWILKSHYIYGITCNSKSTWIAPLR